MAACNRKGKLLPRGEAIPLIECKICSNESFLSHDHSMAQCVVVAEPIPLTKPPLVFRRNNKITLILGPMFAGKSNELRRRARRYSHKRNTTVLCFKPKADTRVEADTHDGDDLWHSVQRACTAWDVIFQIRDRKDHENIRYMLVIDEGQFFSDLHELGEWVLGSTRKIHLMVGALNGDFMMQPFQSVSRLQSMAQKVKVLSAICMDCKEECAFYSRKHTLHATDTCGAQNNICPGGADKYSACCAICWRPPTTSVA